MAVFADFGWARIDVMRPSDNMSCWRMASPGLVVGISDEILSPPREYAVGGCDLSIEYQAEVVDF